MPDAVHIILSLKCSQSCFRATTAARHLLCSSKASSICWLSGQVCFVIILKDLTEVFML